MRWKLNGFFLLRCFSDYFYDVKVYKFSSWVFNPHTLQRFKFKRCRGVPTLKCFSGLSHLISLRRS